MRKLAYVKKVDPRLLLLTGLGLILTIPCIVYGFPFYGDDSVEHAIYYTHFADQIRAGDFYPRWLQGMNGGLGSPALFYYPPVAYYLTSVFKLFFVSDPYGWRQLGMSASLALIASGLSVYLWLKRTLGQNAAFVAAAIYMVMPYHLGYDLYTRGALGEFWAFVWMPLILYFVEDVLSGHRFGAAGLAISYALLIMTHLPTTLIFSMVPVCYAFYMADAGRRIKVMAITLGAMLLGVGLSAIYLWPALAMQKFIFMEEATAWQYYYENQFLFTKLKWRGRGSDLFWMSLGVGALACCAFIVSRSNLTDKIKCKALFWIVTAVLCVVMMTPLSKPVWQIIPLLQKIQFPWRFNAILSLAASVLLALGLLSIKRAYSLPTEVVRVMMILFVAVWIQDAATRAWHAYPVNYVDEAVIRSRNKWLELMRDTYEYRPRWVVSIREQDLELLQQRIGKSGDGVTKVNIVKGAGTAVVNKWEPREITVQVDTPGGALLNVSQFYYPGWTASFAGESNDLTVQPSKPGGLLSVSVPAGTHRVLLRLGRKMPEMAGGLVSAASAVMTLLLIVWLMFSRAYRLEHISIGCIGEVDLNRRGRGGRGGRRGKNIINSG